VYSAHPPLGAAMSSTEHGTRTVRRTVLAAAGVGLLLAGCGGGNSDSGAAASPATTAADSTAPPADADFCDQAAGIDDRVDAAVSGLDEDSLPDAFRQLTVELRAIDAPAAIADDWETMAGGLDRMADALADFDITDLSTLEALDDAEGDLTAAGDRVDTYLRDQCGIDS
jgi:hypothetical protein